MQQPLDRPAAAAATATGELSDLRAAAVRLAARTAGAARQHHLAAELAGSDPRPGPSAQGLLAWWRFTTGDLDGAQSAARAALECGCDQPRARAVASAVDVVRASRSGSVPDLDRHLAALPAPDGDLLRMRALGLRGDQAAAARAARRVLVIEPVPEALVEVAVDEALHGSSESAVSATERARAASPAAVDAVDQVSRRVAATGDRRRLGAFLAAGLAAAPHRGYHRALREELPVPWYARRAVNDIATSVLALLVAITLLVRGEPVAGALAMVALLLLGFVLSWLPRQGLPRAESRTLDKALHGYRRREKAGLVHDDRTTASQSAAAGRCVCDTAAGVLPSPAWDHYVQEHLATVDVLPGTGFELRVCPTRGDLWLHVPTRGVTLTVATATGRARVRRVQSAAQAEAGTPACPGCDG